jgi:hypothetical protein
LGHELSSLAGVPSACPESQVKQLSRRHAGLFVQPLTTDINEKIEISRSEGLPDQGEIAALSTDSLIQMTLIDTD